VGSEQSSVISNQLSVGSEQSVGEDTDNCSLETDYLHISSPEDLKLLDPACGSGHILTYAFDLLYAIYEEEGYAPADIARLILEKNIFGVEIDPRAGALAAFALVMKARAKDRRLFTRSGRDVNPNICVLENVTFTDAELQQYSAAVGGEVESGDLFTEPLMETLRQFEQADNFGSLIRPMLSDVSYVRGLLKTLRENLGGDLFLFGVHERVLKVLKQAEFLAPRYHVVVANPPYMGRKGMNEQIKVFTEEYYEVSSSDTYSAFIDRSTQLIGTYGYSALITMDAWMFSPAFEEFRLKILRDHRVINLAHFGPRAFDSISGEIVSTAAFIIDNKNGSSNNTPVFINATSGNNEAEKSAILRDKKLLFSLITQEDFMQIKGSPLAYWLGKSFINDLVKLPTLGEFARPRSGLTTGDNERYLRYWYEVEKFNKSIADINYSDKTFDKWVPLNGGSNFRKWYGSNTQVIFWENNGASIRENPAATMANPEFQFKHGVTWSKITGTDLSVRKTDTGFVFSAVGLKAFPPEESINYVCGFLNSSLVKYLVPIFSSNITILSGDIAKYPLKETSNPLIDRNVERLCQISKLDWDSFETSWDFIILQLLDINNIKPKLKNTYCILRARWQEITKEMKQLEKENNQIFIESYELQNELASEVTLDEITLTCNPYYRYNHNKTEEELEALLLADTMKEFISYAVGCMFGRYSLEKPGLVLANQGEGIAEFRMQIAEWKKIQNSEFKIQNLTFEPDEDNVIPVLDGEWFEDDIVERFKKFLRVTFGDEHYEENLAFIEKAIGRDVRSYFVKEFYKDHVQTYKKRPIYWLFSSPKGSFNALIYMHRYQPDTVSIVLNGYLREYIKKLNAHKAQLERTSVSGSASQSQKTKALKEISQINKALSELKEYESEVLYPLAMEQVRIDLDDGVKINYGKFGAALNPIKGL
jgi:type II restriction/modification system DNA methylase subunit YeeA